MKGILFAGNHEAFLSPTTLSLNKCLLPIYDKPLIYYPLSTLILAGIQEILIITSSKDKPLFEKLLKDGSQLGCKFIYKTLNSRDIVGGFKKAENFIGNDNLILIKGDIIFYGLELSNILNKDRDLKKSLVYKCNVSEKKDIAGLFFYENSTIQMIKELAQCKGESTKLDDINEVLLKKDKLKVKILPKGITQLYIRSIETSMQASQFIEVVEERQGLKIGSIEAAAFEMGFISNDQLKKLAKPLLKSGYGKELLLYLD